MTVARLSTCHRSAAYSWHRRWLGIGPWQVYTYGGPLVRKMVYRGDAADYGMRIALASARAAGLRVIQKGSGFGLDGDGSYAYLDTESRIGVTIEPIEIPKRMLPPESIFPAPESEGWP